MIDSKGKQSDFFKNSTSSYGGDLQKKRLGRGHGRPLSTHNSMHFVLRSTKATGEWSFLRHKSRIEAILAKFARKYGVRIHSFANVGNHLHIHLQLTSRYRYRPFIRAITAAIMMSVTGTSRWSKTKLKNGQKFWDRRPFSRIITGYRAILNMRDYIQINRFQGDGYTREESRFIVKWDWDKGRMR